MYGLNISKTTSLDLAEIDLGSRSNSGAQISKETTGSELEVSGTAHQLVLDCYLRFRRLKCHRHEMPRRRMTPSLPSLPASQSAERVAVRTSFNMVHCAALLYAPYCHANLLLHHWQEDLNAAFTTNLKHSSMPAVVHVTSKSSRLPANTLRLSLCFSPHLIHSFSPFYCLGHLVRTAPRVDESREFVPVHADARREGRCELTQHRQRVCAAAGSLDGPAPAPDLACDVPSSPRRQRQPGRMEGGTVGAPRRIGRTMTTRCCRTREPVPSAAAAEWEGHCEVCNPPPRALTICMAHACPEPTLTHACVAAGSLDGPAPDPVRDVPGFVSPAGWSRGAVGAPRHLARTTTQRAPCPAGLILKPPATYIRDEPGPQSLPPRWRRVPYIVCGRGRTAAREVSGGCWEAGSGRRCGRMRRVVGGRAVRMQDVL
ncbi:hypothetical protein GGX14DRAFT_387945 [Mycena pura]|uniref:Uncharacterized protein n=1 Tax=Mycena pura TaxID=153505 RepID=A0AAD6VT75_9AGAR|nr:hypothetical protein GGX14DRAFT_387945 [Mycena pura]